MSVRDFLRTLSISAAVFAVAGCGVKYEKLMTDEALATADRVCGVYRLVDITWDGERMDLNNDGVASESFLEECLSGDYLGYVMKDGVVECTVEAIEYGSQSPVRVSFPFFYGDYSVSKIGTSFDTHRYTLLGLSVRYTIDSDGTFQLDYDSYQRSSSHSPESEFCDVYGINIIWDRDGDGDFIVSGRTKFLDNLTGNEVEGCETIRYHCISTKEKKKR